MKEKFCKFISIISLTLLLLATTAGCNSSAATAKEDTSTELYTRSETVSTLLI